jgi:DNA-binding NarL/FixJ family response regulator
VGARQVSWRDVTAVLLCDDAAAYGLLFGLWMRQAGVSEVEQAHTAAETLSLAERLQPQVIVLDHLLPDGTSEQLLPRLREAAPQSRVLLISGLPEDKLAEAAAASGADGHVGKWAPAQVMQDAVLALMP